MAFGRTDINEVLAYFSLCLGDIPMDGGVQMNRNQAKLLLDWAKKEYPNVDPIEVAKRLITIGTGDTFHRNHCTTMLYINRYKGRLIMVGKEQKAREQAAAPKEVQMVGRLRKLE